MFAFDWYFGPLNGDLSDRVLGLQTALERTGQIAPEAVIGRVGDGVRLTGLLPLADSLDERHHSRYVRKRLDGLRARCEQETLTVHHRSEEPDHTTEPSEWLLLSTGVGALDSPLHCPHTRRGVPLYAVPLDADELERVFFWARLFRRMHGVELSCGPLEMESYREMADPDSVLMADGRAHAALIEEALQVPVYVHLFCAYGPAAAGHDRPCPGCGRGWRRKGEPYEFRCEPCRLVSDLPCSTDWEDWVARHRPVSQQRRIDIRARGRSIGVLEVEGVDTSMGVLEGAFVASAHYAAVADVFRLFADDQTERYYSERDELHLTAHRLPDEAVLSTHYIHITDLHDELSERRAEVGLTGRVQDALAGERVST